MRRLPVRSAIVLAGLAIAAACRTPQWPVNGPLSSPFGVRMEGTWPGMHRGVDIATAVGTPVRPLLDGRVRFAGEMSGYGLVVWIDHGPEMLSVYAHLSETAVQPGQDVTKATVIGLTGQSGHVTGPHLHLEVWRWGREVDPVLLLGGPPKG